MRPSVRIVLVLALIAGGAFAAASIGSYMTGKDDRPRRIHFAIIADPHLYDPSLGTSGTAFADALNEDVKMIEHSEALFTHATRKLVDSRQRPSFILIPGDLTKDGEAQSHRLMASRLAGLKAAGIPAFVIPGNHDIANPEASRYDDTGATPVDGIDAAEFARLYADFGYAQALARDPHSLTYIVEPAPGFWLFAIDSCRYGGDTDKRIDGGRLRPETVAWLRVQLQRARAGGKTVLAMMHHGLVEHMLGQGKHAPDLLIEDWDAVGRSLAADGLRVVFTGHAHTQDITRRDWEDRSFLIDVQTGSLVTYPNPYRLVTLDSADRLVIRSFRVEQPVLAEGWPGFRTFADFARDFTYRRELDILDQELANRSGLPARRREELAPMLADALLANQAGDELPTVRAFKAPMAMASSKIPDEATVGGLILSLWHDLPPADNDLDLVMRGRTDGTPANTAVLRVN